MIEIDPSLVTIITTLLSIGLGLFSKYKHDQSSRLQGGLDVATEKAELGARLISKIKEANKDSNITPEEFTGIVNTAEELVTFKQN